MTIIPFPADRAAAAPVAPLTPAQKRFITRKTNAREPIAPNVVPLTMRPAAEKPIPPIDDAAGRDRFLAQILREAGDAWRLARLGSD